MHSKFIIQIRETFNKPYLKVFIADPTQLEEVYSLLRDSKAVQKCNITHNTKDDITVYPSSLYSSIDEVKQEVTDLLNSYYNNTLLSDYTQKQSNKIQILLSNYPEAQHLYIKAIRGIESGNDYRHALDDLRLSIEKFLRILLGNKKSIENQKSELSAYLNNKGYSSDVIENILRTINNIAYYFNGHVKHENDVKIKDINYIVDSSNTFINSLFQENKVEIQQTNA